MKVGLYPGSFNPWHEGHKDILMKSLQIFDRVIISIARNPDKEEEVRDCKEITKHSYIQDLIFIDDKVGVDVTKSTLKNLVQYHKPCAVIRGLRNGHDLQYEMNAQYWNEDVGVEVPFVYFISDRALSHVSSSAIRTVEKLGLPQKY